MQTPQLGIKTQDLPALSPTCPVQMAILLHLASRTKGRAGCPWENVLPCASEPLHLCCLICDPFSGCLENSSSSCKAISSLTSFVTLFQIPSNFILPLLSGPSPFLVLDRLSALTIGLHKPQTAQPGPVLSHLQLPSLDSVLELVHSRCWVNVW